MSEISQKIGFSHSEIMDNLLDSNYVPITAIISRIPVVKPISDRTVVITNRITWEVTVC